MPVVTISFRSCCRTIIVVSVLLCLCSVVWAQHRFTGRLLNKLDSSAIPFAAIKLTVTRTNIVTDLHGLFFFDIPSRNSPISLEITAIGVRTTTLVAPPYSDTMPVYVDMLPGGLNDVVIKGRSAADVLRQAVKTIPTNYADSSYFDYSLYRYYEMVNGRFYNLIEAEPVVMFRLARGAKRIDASEAFAILQMRRSNMRTFFSGGSNKEDLPSLFNENPVYHLSDGALEPSKINAYTCSFDTTNHSPDNYVINYVCKDFSSDSHGWILYHSWIFHGESWEKGTVVIDRNTLAIKQIKRHAIRYPEYMYHAETNLIRPEKKYFMEMVSGELEVNYDQSDDGKWFTKNIFYSYTNDFFRAVFGSKDYTITDVYEWRSVSRSQYASADVAAMYGANKQAKKMKFAYDSRFWSGVKFPFHFHSQANVYRDLELNGPLEKQFLEESKKDGS